MLLLGPLRPWRATTTANRVSSFNNDGLVTDPEGRRRITSLSIRVTARHIGFFSYLFVPEKIMTSGGYADMRHRSNMISCFYFFPISFFFLGFRFALVHQLGTLEDGPAMAPNFLHNFFFGFGHFHVGAGITGSSDVELGLNRAETNKLGQPATGGGGREAVGQSWA